MLGYGIICLILWLDFGTVLIGCFFLVFHFIHLNCISVYDTLSTVYSFFISINFYTPVSRRAVLCNWVWRAGGRPHNNFISVYWIFIKLDHTIPLWKGKSPIYFGVIRSKVKVTITINRIFNRLKIYIDGRILWCTHFLFTGIMAMRWWHDDVGFVLDQMC